MSELPIKETPLMKQYNRIKGKYPDAILLFRVGDFYETFNEDAVKTSTTLGIVLTKRSNGKASEMDLAGFPYHALDTYLPKLVRAGFRVAICEQLEDPKLTKTIVQRGVTEMITPGITDNEKLLNHKSNNFLCSVFTKEDATGVSFLDISTGEFLVTEGKPAVVEKLIQNFKPSEIIFSKSQQKYFREQFNNSFYTYSVEDWIYQPEHTYDLIIRHFEVQNLKGFGIEEMPLAIITAGAILQYLSDNEHKQIKHINKISRIDDKDFVWMDKFTLRNLELIFSNAADGKSLLDIMDTTQSPMGARLMRRWIMMPLKNLNIINERLNAVEFLKAQTPLTNTLLKNIKACGDLERIIAKVANGKITPREVIQLKKSLGCIHEIKQSLEKVNDPLLQMFQEQLNPCLIIQSKIEKELNNDAPVSVLKGNAINDGVHAELDELRSIAQNGKSLLLEIQKKESVATGISSLKINFNNVFGYYLEVTNSHKDKVPENWIRKQTLVNAERYITPELKVYEEKITGAESRIQQIEIEIYQQLLSVLSQYIEPIQSNARIVAVIDCLLSFSQNAIKHNYCKPMLDESLVIDIKNGRHAVIEHQLKAGEKFVPNDVYLDDETQQIIMLTGPNMSGKSALLRQTALIVIMAQCGSFVPAEKATLGITDKIFTRVGASDNMSSGESTFMVEMNETASILNNLSNRSLVLLDEIGRGTSTFDGISIAWSIAEYLHNHRNHKPKTLFATHYHELNELEEKFPRIKNFNVSIKETGNKILFMRKMVRGGSQHSFGIHVARLSGIPESVVNRANEILKHLEENSISKSNSSAMKEMVKQDYQLNIFQVRDPMLQRIHKTLNETDINTLSPVEALLKLQELKNELK